MGDHSDSPTNQVPSPSSKHWFLELGFWHFLAAFLLIAAIGQVFNRSAEIDCIKTGFEKGVPSEELASLCSSTVLKLDVSGSNSSSESVSKE